MRKITDREIRKRTVIELTMYLEKEIEKITIQTINEIDKENKQRIKQGISPKIRIDVNSLKKAIKTINSKKYCNLPERAGGNKKVGEKNDMHTQNNKKQPGVEIS